VLKTPESIRVLWIYQKNFHDIILILMTFGAKVYDGGKVQTKWLIVG